MKPEHRARHIAEGFFTLKQSPGPGLCGVKGCRKDGHHKKLGLCHAHWQFRWRMKSPKKSAYCTLRDHAKARNLPFTISFDYFAGICDAFQYFDKPDIPRNEWLTIDRKDITRGYEPGNIVILTMSENVAKGNRERHLPAYVQSILARKRGRMHEEVFNGFAERDSESCPF